MSLNLLRRQNPITPVTVVKLLYDAILIARRNFESQRKLRRFQRRQVHFSSDSSLLKLYEVLFAKNYFSFLLDRQEKL